jgi:transposase
LVTQHGGTPYIDFKDNAKGGSRCEVWNKMFYYYSLHKEEFYEHYHRRSNVETTFQMIKSKFDEQVRSKTATSQINEILCKVLCHNICCLIQSMFEFGIDPNFGQHERLPEN